MNKEWVDKKKAEYEAEIVKKYEHIKNEINSATLNEEYRAEYLKMLDKIKNNPNRYNPLEDTIRFDYGLNGVGGDDLKSYIKWSRGLGISDYKDMLRCQLDYERFIDSEPMEFDGDIIITDPCYVVSNRDDWSLCNCGFNMEALGVNHYITRDTIYGDWSCTTYDTDTKESIGSFCADAGLVSVFLLDEILKYNPEFDYHINRTWTTTLIKDFKGTIQMVVKREEGVYEDTTKYHTKGETWEDFSLEVVGHGINKVTGEPINFVGTQTGL